MTLENGAEAWALSPSNYVQEAIWNAEGYLESNFGGQSLPNSASSPWHHDYTSELDATPELNPDLAHYYQLQIGVLHWIVELG